jgi:hypothetical protein
MDTIGNAMYASASMDAITLEVLHQATVSKSAALGLQSLLVVILYGRLWHYFVQVFQLKETCLHAQSVDHMRPIKLSLLSRCESTFQVLLL